MERVPYNGYLEIWLQRVTQPKAVGIPYSSNEVICKIVNSENTELWVNDWISSEKLKSALNVSKIIVGSVSEASEVVLPAEIEIFKKKAMSY